MVGLEYLSEIKHLSLEMLQIVDGMNSYIQSKPWTIQWLSAAVLNTPCVSVEKAGEGRRHTVSVVED